MAFTAAVCSQCGGKINVDPSKESGTCPFCGTAFVREKVVNRYVAQNNFAGATVHIQDGSDTDKLYRLARRAAATGNADDALKYYGLLNLRNPDDWETTFYRAWFKKDASLAKTVCVALGLIEASDADNKKELYAQIGDRLASELDGNKLAEISACLLDKDSPEQAGLLRQLLQAQLDRANGDTASSLFGTLQKVISKNDPAYKDYIDLALVPFVSHCAPESKAPIEEAIRSCAFIDQKSWLKMLHRHVTEEKKRGIWKHILIWILPAVIVLWIASSDAPLFARAIGTLLILIYAAIVGIVTLLSKLLQAATVTNAVGGRQEINVDPAENQC